MRLLICDDHRVLVDSLSELFESRGHAVLRALTPAEAVRIAEQERPDACLMDVEFPDANGIDAIPDVLQASDTTSVIVLTGSADPEIEHEAMRRGAALCATKADDLETFVTTVEALSDDPHTAPPERAEARQPPRSASAFDVHPLARFLTARERDVLTGLVTGESTASLCTRLTVGPATVRTHIQSVLTKLGVHSRLEAVAFAIRERLVVPATFPGPLSSRTAKAAQPPPEGGGRQP